MRWIDHAYVRFWPRRPCFEDGWGDAAKLRVGVDRSWREAEPAVPVIRWSEVVQRRSARTTEGRFESPEEGLPPEARRARVQAIEPRGQPIRGWVVVLAAWGDEGFEARQRLVRQATEAGVAALLLENPFYGARRRLGQDGARIRSVSDFVTMGRATVVEARALLAWARTRHERVGVAGFSMGAQMAAMSAVLVPWPVRAVLFASATSPARVFFDGPLIADVRGAPLGPGGARRLRDVMEGFSVLDLPPPHDPSLARLVGTRRDGIVPPEDTTAIARHWGATARWIDDGHVSAMVRRPHAMGQAIVDAFA